MIQKCFVKIVRKSGLCGNIYYVEQNRKENKQMNDKIWDKLAKKTLSISTDAYKYAKVIYSYCTRECISEDLYELAPIMKELRNMVESIHINLLMLTGEQEYDEDMI